MTTSALPLLLLRLLVVLGATLSVWAVAQTSGLQATGTRASVVVSIHPYFDLTRQIAGDAAEVSRLLDPSASPHSYDPGPREVARLADADLVIMSGGLDEWLRPLVAASGTRAPLLVMLDEVVVPIGDEAPPAQDGVTPVNPHLWLDPVLMQDAARRIADALAEVDPDHAALYRANADALVASLAALDADLRATLAGVAGAPFVPFHDAWPYFADRYDLDLVIEIEPFPGREPSPRDLADAIGLIEERGVRVIFTDVQLNPRPAEVIAESAGVAIATLDPLGGAPGRESYQDLLRYNARVVAEALGR